MTDHRDRHRDTLDGLRAAGPRDWEVSRPPRTGRGRDASPQEVASDPTLPAGAVVDLGCGPGWHLPALPPHGPSPSTAPPRCCERVPVHAPGAAAAAGGSPRPAAAPRHAAGGVGQQELRAPQRLAGPDGAVGPAPRHGRRAGWPSSGSSAATASTTASTPTTSRAFVLPVARRPAARRARSVPVSRSTSIDDPRGTTTATRCPYLLVRVRRLRTLADTVGPGHAVAAGRAQPVPARRRPRGRLLRARPTGVGRLCCAAASPRSTAIRVALLREHRIGMTDLVKRTTATGLRTPDEEYRDGPRTAGTALCLVGTGCRVCGRAVRLEDGSGPPRVTAGRAAADRGWSPGLADAQPEWTERTRDPRRTGSTPERAATGRRVSMTACGRAPHGRDRGRSRHDAAIDRSLRRTGGHRWAEATWQIADIEVRLGTRGRVHASGSGAHVQRVDVLQHLRPSCRVGAFVRIGNRPNEGHAEVTTCIYLPDGRVGFMFSRPEITDNERFDAGGASFEVISPSRNSRSSYSGKVVMLDRSPGDGRPPCRVHQQPLRARCDSTSTSGEHRTRGAANPWGSANDPVRSSPRATTSSSRPPPAPITVGDDEFAIDGRGPAGPLLGTAHLAGPLVLPLADGEHARRHRDDAVADRPQGLRRDPPRLRVGRRRSSSTSTSHLDSAPAGTAMTATTPRSHATFTVEHPDGRHRRAGADRRGAEPDPVAQPTRRTGHPDLRGTHALDALDAPLAATSPTGRGRRPRRCRLRLVRVPRPDHRRISRSDMRE